MTVSESCDIPGPLAPRLHNGECFFPPSVLGKTERENMCETQAPSRLPVSAGFLPGRMGLGGVPHAGSRSEDLTHRVLSQGLNQSSVSALEAAAGTSWACGSRL